MASEDFALDSCSNRLDRGSAIHEIRDKIPEIRADRDEYQQNEEWQCPTDHRALTVHHLALVRHRLFLRGEHSALHVKQVG